MKGRIISNQGVSHYFLKEEGLAPEREVSEAEFRQHFPPREGLPQGFEGSWNRPVHSEGAAVHPRQIARARELATQRGVPTDFDTEGRPIFTSRKHQQRYLRSIGFHNHDENWSGNDRKPPEPEPKEYDYSDLEVERPNG